MATVAMLFLCVAVTSLVLSAAEAWDVPCSSLHPVHTTPFNQFIGDWLISDVYVERWPGSDTCLKIGISNATASGMNWVLEIKHGNRNIIFNQNIQASGDNLGEWTNTCDHRTFPVQQRLLAAEPTRYFVIADCNDSAQVIYMGVVRRADIQLSASEKQKVEQLVSSIKTDASSFHHTQDSSC